MKKKTSYAQKQKRLRQIFCIILAALMLLGVLMAVLPYLLLHVRAEDTVSANDTIAAEDTVTEEADLNCGPLLRIGLMFGSGVTPSFAVRANSGFKIGHVDNTTDAITPLWETPNTYIAACIDDNLALTDGYYIPSKQNVIIGGYHLDLPTAYKTMDEIQEAVRNTNKKLQAAGIYSALIYAFPAYRSGNLYVRIGDFGSAASLTSKLPAIVTALGETPSPIYPAKDVVTLLAPDSNLILFEYASQTGKLGLEAIQNETAENTEENYIITPAENTYQGCFLFARYNSGISVTNMLHLEQYVAGVVPYEIGNTWKPEALKAFSIVVRSFALANPTKHASLGVDLCNGSDCQVYMGTKKQNAAVRSAVSATAGQVITYNGKVCTTIYSAVMGGCTVNVEQIWNGTKYPYLRAVSTPWEDYASHSYGEWYSEVSAHNLYLYLAQTKGYTQLKGDIADVVITEFAENSTYVYRLDIIDIYGNKISLKGTDVIRTVLGRYLKSANFVVGRNGNIPALNRNLTMLTDSGEIDLPLIQNQEKTTIQVMTDSGIKEIDISTGLEVKQGNGSVTTFSLQDAVYDIPEDALLRLQDDSHQNFLFIGKGWGHGGGISQWGIRDLANQGATCEEIIHAYFTDVLICDYDALISAPKE